MLVAYLVCFACDMTLAWSSGVFDHFSLPKEMTWRCPAEIFASHDHGPLFARIVGGVVTAAIGFSMISPAVGSCHVCWAIGLDSGPSR